MIKMSRTAQNGIALALGAVLIMAAVAVGYNAHHPRQLQPRLGFAPISSQGTYPRTSFSGVIDPTNSSFAGGLVACTSSCSAGLIDQNRAAIQAAIDYASANRVTVYIPPGEYPIGRKSGQAYGVDFNGDSNVTISAYNVTLRASGNAASSEFDMLYVRNASNIKITGATLSQRDVTNSTSSDSMLLIGDGGTTSVDNVEINDVKTLEGVGGDCLRLNGGSSADTVTRVQLIRSYLTACAQSAVHVKPGISELGITNNWFLNNDGRDVYLESPADNETTRFSIVGNQFDRSASATSKTSVELAGYGSATNINQSVVKENRILNGILVAANLTGAVIGPNVVTFNRSGVSTAAIDLSGKIVDVSVVDNYIIRDVGADNGSAIKTHSAGGNSPVGVAVRGNRIYQYSGAAAAIDVSETDRFIVRENRITYGGSTADSGGTGFPGIYCSGSSTVPCAGLIATNHVARGDQNIKASLSLGTKTTHDNTVVEARQAGRGGNSVTIAFVGDSGANAGTRSETTTAVTIHFKPAVTTVANVETLLAASSLIGVRTSGTGSNVLQTTVDEFTSTALAGGLQAGRMLAGVKILKGSNANVAQVTIRDNIIDGAADGYYLDADGTDYNEGAPLISGNALLNVATEIAGGVTTYRLETMSDSESIASGALNNSKHTSFLSTTGTVAYTLADAPDAGWVHCFKVKAVGGLTAGTLTPAHLGDGSTHTITWSAVGGYACLAWDSVSGKYWVQGSSGVTVN